MIVTRFKYPLERHLVTKIDLMIDRCHGKGAKRDAVLLCEGAEGEGKTTLSIALAYYIQEKTGRKFDNTHVFFDIEKMIDFAQNTEKQIIIWDEPALQALSTDWASSSVKNLTRLLMMARKKRHFIIINVTKFYKFNEYIVVDRPLALLHVYSRKNIQSGRFMYIRKKNLEPLWRDYRFSKRRTYKKHASKKVRGTFPDILNPKYKNNVLSEFDNAAYEKEKDAAIRMIGKDDTREKKCKLEQLQLKIATMKGLTQKAVADGLGISTRTLQRWKNKTPPITTTPDTMTLNNTMGNVVSATPTLTEDLEKEGVKND